jgi:hypothetical protein
MTTHYSKPSAKRPRPTAASSRKKARSAVEGKPETELVTFRLQPDTVKWLRKWGASRKKSLNGFAQEVLDCVRLHGFVGRGQHDELEVDRAAHKYDPIDYQNHVFWRRVQQFESKKPGWDITSRLKPEKKR